MTRDDAKIFAMIDDMDRDALLEALDHPRDSDAKDTNQLRVLVRRKYENSTLDAAEIAMAWERIEENS